jgi:HK97 family phage major capsid protein
MPAATDAVIARLSSELEERRAFQEQLSAGAEESGRDLNAQEMELYTRATDRMTAIEQQLAPLREGVRIATESRSRTAELVGQFRQARGEPVAAVEYRSPGRYIVDVWQSGVGDGDARRRVEMYTRAAQHQTTADNLGVIPEPIVGDVINFIDSARPVVTVLGPVGVPGGRFNRPKVTQHTDVAAQAGEKAELVSRKMLITRLQVLMATYGGYVNVSRQDIDWSVPQIMDIVVNDLAAQYAIDTETATIDALETAATAGPTIPTGPADANAYLGAVWAAVATSWTATQGVGRPVLAIPPDMLQAIGPLFAPYNPAGLPLAGQGFSAAGFASGVVGTLSGVIVVMSPTITASTMLVVNTSAAEVYEQRVGALQVVEPSVLGVQVAYAGYFAAIVVEPGGVVKITKTP